MAMYAAPSRTRNRYAGAQLDYHQQEKEKVKQLLYVVTQRQVQATEPNRMEWNPMESNGM